MGARSGAPVIKAIRFGLNFYRGLFYYCEGDGDYDKYHLDKDECVGTYYNDDEGGYVKRRWVNLDENE